MGKGVEQRQTPEENTVKSRCADCRFGGILQATRMECILSTLNFYNYGEAAYLS